MTMAMSLIPRKLWLTLAVMFVLVSGGCYCHNGVIHKKYFYGSNTAYEKSFTWRERKLLKGNDSFVPDTCTPIHISAAFRHAIRFPEDKLIEIIKKSVDKIRWKITNGIYANLNNTAIVFPDYDSEQLTGNGKEEMQNTGKRIAQRYESLLKDAQQNEKIFYTSNSRRAKDTGISFQDGLTEAFGNQSQEIIERNDLLRFYKNCPQYNKLFEGETALLEYDNFLKGSELTTLSEKFINNILPENDTSLQTGTETVI